MSIMNGNQQWPPLSGHQVNGNRSFHFPDDGPGRTQTPIDNSQSQASVPEASTTDSTEDDRQRAFFADIFRRTEANISHIFGEDGSYDYAAIESLRRPITLGDPLLPPTTDHAPLEERPIKRVKRVIDEDDYGDDDDEDDEDNGNDDDSAQDAKSKSAAQAHKGLLSPSKSGSSPVQSVTTPDKHLDKSKDDISQGSQASQERNKSSEDARKQLEQDRTATEQAVKRSFHTMFYTLENDRTAMLEQQQLEEAEKQLQAEMDKNNSNQNTNGTSGGENHGSLSSANLGASSLTLKHLIARIDMKRDMVRASDAELRHLMNEVRKNRSKWASEENVNQEELYEAVEKVLTELKAHTEYSTPFLQKVNKRDAPDYYNLITKPMDLGTMTKKLKSTQYKSKAEFVADLNLIWDNCLRYNQDMNHPLRRMANGMRREAEKLIPLIPDLVIRPRAEVEAEERRKLNGGDDDNGDDSDDEPIMSSRGRNTTGAKGAKSRKAPTDQKEATPGVDQKPVLQLNGLLAKAHREGSELDGSNGFATPPIAGSATPGGMNGHSGIASNGDAMDIDGPSLNGMALNHALNEAQEQVFEDDEYKIYKQLTKKDRAQIAMRRYQLFNGRKLNVDEPALLRTKAKMRNFLRHQQQAEPLGATSPTADSSAAGSKDAPKAPETLAEGMEEDDGDILAPDYYETQSLIPDIPPKLQWVEDGDGQVINHHEEYLKTIPTGLFTAPKGQLSERLDANLRQMQETRKVCAKIAVVKQMQIQTQVYQNQFPKYEPEPFVEHDIEPHVVCSADNLVMDPAVNRAALQRSVAKLLYHAGFEEMQPSALDAITDIAGDYFHKLSTSFKIYAEADRTDPTPVYAQRGARVQPRFTDEEILLHTLHENGYSVEDLESYAKDEVDRLGNKLVSMHDRMKTHLSDLLRPALQEGTGDGGASSFNEGSDQFVSGDFAEDLGEDYFGFRDLGLAGELGGMLSVPLHLLHSRVRMTYTNQNITTGPADAQMFDELAPPDPVTKDNIHNQIGLAKNFFLAKLHANGDQPLIEDADLPVKQQRPRPRLGATGKIVAAQKRPPKEQNAINKKKKKMEAAAAAAAEKANAANASPEKNKDKKLPAKAGAAASSSSMNAPSLPVAPEMSRAESMQSQGANSQTDKTDTGMMSPESMER